MKSQMGHQLIHGLVYSSSPGQALERARQDIFYPLVEQHEFDYFETLDENKPDRLEDIPAVAPASEPQGQELIDTGWMSTITEYQHQFKHIQGFLDNHGLHEYWTDKEVHQEYQGSLQRLGELQGPATFLYDPEAQGIRTQDHLEHVQNTWHEHQPKDFENRELYVVSADAHY